MAFYSEDDEEQQDPNAQTGPQQTSQSSGLIGGGSSAPGGARPAAAGAPDSPGSFVGLKTYLDANKPQAQKLGNQVAGQLNSAVDQASQEVAGLGGKFDQKVQAGTIQNLDTAKDEGLDILGKAATTGQVDQNQQARFKQVANAQYAGPNTLNEAADVYQPAYQKVTEAQKKADLSKTESGRQELLRGMNNSPSYTPGAQRFDSYLLNNDDARSKFAAAQTGAGGLAGQMSAQEQAAAQKAADVKSRTEITADAIRKAFGQFDDPTTPQDESAGALGGYGSQIKKKMADSKASTTQLAERLKNKNLTADDLRTLGLQNQANYGVDLSNFFQGGDPTAAGVTSAEDRARYNALMSLADPGGQNLYAGASEGDFGNYRPSVDAAGFQNAVQTSRDLFENQGSIKKAQEFLDQVRAGSSGINGGYFGNFANAIGSAKDYNAVQQAFAELEAAQNATNADRNYYSGQVALRDYLTQAVPNARKQMLVSEPQLPTNSDGTIDWGQITAPTGSAGKYPQAPEEEFDPNAPKKR